MATNPRIHIRERKGPSLVSSGRRAGTRKANSLKARLVTTALALVALGLVLRFLPPASKNAHANVKSSAISASTNDLRYSGLQMSQAVGGEALYLDGLVTNNGDATLTDATAEVRFVDSQGQVVGSVEKPLVGMARGGIDLIPNEFARNPITPKEVRFFRVAVGKEQVPPTWNHELPELKIVAIKAE